MHKTVKFVLLMLFTIVLLGGLSLSLSCKSETSPSSTTQAPAKTSSAQAEAKVLKLGMIIALTGPAAGGGVTYERGMDVWVDYINSHGGITAGGQNYKVQAMYYDDKGFVPAESLKSVQKGVLEDKCNIYFTTSATAVCEALMPFMQQQNALLLTWGGSMAMRPEWNMLIGAYSLFPQTQALTPVYIHQRYPQAKRVAYIVLDAPFAPDDATWTEMGFVGEGLEMVFNKYIPAETMDFNPLMTSILATKPDIIDASWLGNIGVSVMETGMNLGYEGAWYIPDLYMADFIKKIPNDYLNGTVGLQPSYDDPAMVGEYCNGLYKTYAAKWPGEDLSYGFQSWYGWGTLLEGIKLADSVDPVKISQALLSTKTIHHPALGDSQWAGSEFSGADNMLGTPILVGEAVDGKEVCIAKVSYSDWIQQHRDLVAKYYKK